MTTTLGPLQRPQPGPQPRPRPLSALWQAVVAPCARGRLAWAAVWVVAVAAGALLAGCGGGAGPAPSAQETAVARATPAQAAGAPVADPVAGLARGLRRHALAQSAAAVDPADAAQQLMAFAEQQYPALFPAGAATQQAWPFVYRHYPATGSYLGVVTGTGSAYQPQGVYVMGGPLGAAPRLMGLVTDFITPVEPPARLDLSQPQAVVQQGGWRTLTVTLQRRAGFNGPVQVDVTGLPAGVTARPLTLPGGRDSAELVLDAVAAAPHSLPTAATVHARADGVAHIQPLSVTVRGAAGQVDTSFGGGVTVTPVDIGEDQVHATAVQADGKLLVAGSAATTRGTQMAVLRYGRDGGLDPSFGNGGKLLLRVGSRGHDAAHALAVQPDGRIVVAGISDQGATGLDMVVLRLLPDGRPDPAFADAGVRVIDLAGDTDRAWAVAVQDDGRIVVGGEANRGASSSGVDFALLRLTAAGALDTSFGDGGRVFTALKSASGGDVLRALALPVIDGQTHILAVGGDGDFLAARYHPDGSLDTRFGAAGKVVGLFNASIGGARAVALLPDGRAVLAGHIHHRFAAAQLTTTGTLDTSFGTAGRVEHAVVANWNEATALVRQSDGRLLLAGWAYSGNSSSGDFAALRLTAAGTLDPGFASAGVLLRPVATGTRNDQARALALQPDDRVPTVRAFIAGEANDSNHDMVVMRLWL